jgi:hypothetical protein
MLFVTGCIAWTSVAIVFGAALFDELRRPVVQGAGPLALLLTLAATQVTGAPLARTLPQTRGVTAMVSGVSAILLGLRFPVDALAIAGILLLGTGIGIVHRTALLALTQGSASARQGAVASLYAAVTYAVAALVVLGGGSLGSRIGLLPVAEGALLSVALVALACSPWTPRLGETAPDMLVRRDAVRRT